MRALAVMDYYRRIVKKSVYSDEYMIVRETLVAMRRDAGLTQRELAQVLLFIRNCQLP